MLIAANVDKNSRKFDASCFCKIGICAKFEARGCLGFGDAVAKDPTHLRKIRGFAMGPGADEFGLPVHRAIALTCFVCPGCAFQTM